MSQTYYDAVKRELGGRVARTRAAMDALDPALRVTMEGFRPGAYLRLRFAGNHWFARISGRACT